MFKIKSLFPKVLDQSIDISGSHTKLWIINGVTFNMSSIFDEPIQNAVKQIEKTIIANTTLIIISIILFLTIISLPIIFLYLRFHSERLKTKIIVYNCPPQNSIESSMLNGNSLLKNIPK